MVPTKRIHDPTLHRTAGPVASFPIAVTCTPHVLLQGSYDLGVVRERMASVVAVAASGREFWVREFGPLVATVAQIRSEVYCGIVINWVILDVQCGAESSTVERARLRAEHRRGEPRR